MQWVSMEKRLNSSGKISKDFHHRLFLKKSNKTWRSGRSSQRSSQTESSSCQCPKIFSGAWMMKIAFRIQKKSRITQWDSRKDIGHCWVQGRKRSGVEVLTMLRKGNGIVQPPKWCNDSKKLVILHSKASVPWLVEILKQKRGKTSIHFNGDSMNTELLFQTIHSVK